MGQLPRFWLHDSLPARLLAPLGSITAALARRRRQRYLDGQRQAIRLPVPVLVVGNIFVGGTGKTPLVSWLVRQLAQRGRRPGILVRGYGGRAPHWPQAVAPDSDPSLVGDEGVLLARMTGAPVAAGPDRPAAAALLLEAGCDVLISDDGLQHYRLARDAEIIVMDSSRGLGNGRCLPAGPLREPPERLASADLVVYNGAPGPYSELSFRLRPEGFVNLADGRRAARLGDESVHAVAGIGNPQRFFDGLAAQGLEVIPHPFPDHHRFRRHELEFGDHRPLVCTEKDAVKLAGLAQAHWWYQPVVLEPDDGTRAALLALLERVLK